MTKENELQIDLLTQAKHSFLTVISKNSIYNYKIKKSVTKVNE
jgi:hypothetical protein